MSDGPSDAAREGRISANVLEAIALLQEAFDEGGYDCLFGLNGAIVRELNKCFRKVNYKLVPVSTTEK
jgi:hypothetical protein